MTLVCFALAHGYVGNCLSTILPITLGELGPWVTEFGTRIFFFLVAVFLPSVYPVVLAGKSMSNVITSPM